MDRRRPGEKAGKHDVRGTFGLEIVENGYVAHSTRRIKEDGRAKRLVIKLIILAITIDANTRSGGERSGERERGIKIGRASCREGVVSVRVDLGGSRIIKKK